MSLCISARSRTGRQTKGRSLSMIDAALNDESRHSDGVGTLTDRGTDGLGTV